MSQASIPSHTVIDEALSQRIRTARHIVFFTGAGVSAESGIPTFRDAQTGLWAQFDASELATPEAFQADPALVWGWYEWRRMKVLQAQPNPAHFAIARLTQRFPHATVITQNVDDLHERAGHSNILHLHGSLHQPRCFTCGVGYSFDNEIPVEPDYGRRVEPPRCARCDGLIRPGVVWFGESLPAQTLQQAFDAAAQCDVLFSIGTSGVVYPAAQMPHIARDANAAIVHINPQPVSGIYSDDWMLIGAAGDLLPKLEREVFF
ncbi:NAD-dependent protein deacylase 1 [Pseudomonas asuensis]|uniref:NAD-dependent protein deacylase n=1 Tax=Pseudomonas asuensis TaxID=1825787 RepID=A0ABQ2GFU0_9PSED|nr:NAD-dependent deacylase [Pseudomonas asuensis]GGL94061.1 NAD-dependent protein deacylase 1 [Pseudomonas asuensis]